MAELAVSHTFNSGEVVSASKFNTNYTTDIAGYINARNAGSATWDQFYVTRSGGVPLTVNNSTGTSSIAQFKDNGTTVFEVLDGGVIRKSAESFVRFQTASNTDISSGAATLISPYVDPSLSPSTLFNTQSEGDFSSGRITVLKSGKYLIFSQFQIISIGDIHNFVTIYIYKNGASISQAVHDTTPDSGVINEYRGISDIVNLNAGDYIEFYAKITNFSGSSAVVSSGSLIKFHKLS